MILASMFPAIVNAYNNLTELVDSKANAAKGSGQQLLFELGGMGGLWGSLAKEKRKCEEYYNNLMMDSDTWRSTLRALLRADLYGVDIKIHEGKENMALYHHKGLWDIVQEMRAMSSNTRDKLSEANDGRPQIDAQDPFTERCKLKHKSDFLRAIEMAQLSLQKLVIS
jgi:hypothetical protein